MKIIVLFSICFCASISAWGQSENNKNHKGFFLWAGAGTLFSFSDDFDSLLPERLSLNFSTDQKHFLSVIYHENSVLDGFPFGAEKPHRLTYSKSGSALAGVGTYKNKSLAFIGSAGISYGQAEYRGKILDVTDSGGWFGKKYIFDYEDYHYLGLSLNGKILWTSPFAGLSLDVYANVHKHPEYGLILSVNAGNIRKRQKQL